MCALTLLRGLYAITPDWSSSACLFEAVEAALLGGCSLIQYRDKHPLTDKRQSRAIRLQSLCRLHGATLLINDDLQLAIEIGADGVHLGRDDADLSVARKLLAEGKIIGASCYNNLALAKKASAHADYLAFGSVYSSQTKPQAKSAGMAIFKQASRLQRPLCAIGGIRLDNARPLIKAGATMLAVCSDLFGSPGTPATPEQVRLQSARYRQLLDDGNFQHN